MPKYTILLAPPDDLLSYLDPLLVEVHVKARSVIRAIIKAQNKAVKAHKFATQDDAEDFEAVAVYRGYLKDLL